VAAGGVVLRERYFTVASDDRLAVAIYAIDAFLPFLSLSGTPTLDRDGTRWAFQIGLLVYNLAGIVLTSILVATLTGPLRKD
jgi:hypothetical protein